MAPAEYLDTLAGFDAILLGAVGHPKVQDHVTLNGLLLPIWRRFDQCLGVRHRSRNRTDSAPHESVTPGQLVEERASERSIARTQR